MPRKTVEIKKIVDYVNDFLHHSADSDSDARSALMTMVENLLMDTGNYNGFSYLNAIDMKSSNNGVTVGINLTANSEFESDSKRRFADTDHTRVYYFLKSR